MFCPTLRRVLPGLAPLALIAVTAAAQTNTTSFSGVVMDGSGARLPNATVVIENTTNGTKQDFVTGNQGDFSFPQILPGPYKVTVTHEGFVEQVRTIELFIATPVSQNIMLSVGGGSISVDVSTDIVGSLNTTDASLGKAFGNEMIQTLPYLANNTLSLLALQPGVVSFDASNTTDTRAGTINGARQDQTNLTLDGVDNNDANYGYAFTGVLRATRDSIQEFRVTTSGANADSGRSSGAQVALQTKSGTNAYHGSAYYYYRGPGTASNQWFNKQSQLISGLPNTRAKVLQHTFGGTFGMPLLRDKLFFFGAYEGYKQASSSVVSRTVPLASLRAGNVTYINDAKALTTTTLTPANIASLDRNCTTSCPGGRGVNAAALAFMNQYPVSNSAGGDGLNTGGYSFASPAPISQVTNIARFDYNLTSKQTLFVRGNLQSDNNLAAYQFPGGVPTSNTYGNNRGVAAGHIFNISDRLINNFRYGWTRYGNAIRGGVSSDYVTFAAFTALAPTTSSTLLIENTHNFADDFTYVKGRHVFQFGGNDRLVYDQRTLTNTLYRTANVTQSYLGPGAIANSGTSLDPATGAFPKVAASTSAFDQAMTAATGIISYASQYVNYRVSGNSLSPLPAGTVPTRNFRNFEQEYYVQDQWKATSKLTLTVGLRYSYLGVPYEMNGQQVRPTSSVSDFLQRRIAGMQAGTSYNALISVAPGGAANNAPGFWTAQTNNFAPRFAFNYSPDGKTSIRGGFMLAYDHFGIAAVNRYNDTYSFGLSSLYASRVGQNVDTTPRFSSGTTVPLSITSTPSPGGNFPVTDPGGSGYITETFDDRLKTPYSENFNLSLQREVAKGMTLTTTYTGRLGRHLIMKQDVALPLNLLDTASGQNYYGAMQQLAKLKDAGTSVASVPQIAYWQNMFPNATYTDPITKVVYRGTQAVYARMSRGNETAIINTLDSGTTASPGGQSFRFYHPQFSTLGAQTSLGGSNYSALQVSLRHSLNRNFIYDFNYTYAKALDQGSSPERSGANTIINTFNPSQMYAVADYDVRHAISADWTVALPYGRGQRFGANAGRAMDALLGGWMLTGVTKFNSALPFSSVSSVGWGTNWNTRSYNVQIAPVKNSGHHSYQPGTSNGKAIIVPYALDQGGTTASQSFRLAYAGETGQRNSLRADGYFSVDPGASKTFRTFEGQSFRVTVEAFNVFNAIRYSTPDSGSGSAAAFGRYTTLLNSPRQLQFSGRYYF